MKNLTRSRILTACFIGGLALAGAGCARDPGAKEARFLKNAKRAEGYFPDLGPVSVRQRLFMLSASPGFGC